ncbi:MAG: hypothetical protein MJ180_02145 [Candidatus Gastranaerophilales bacterium]|nr:hypothetical protein [Candidatus Gastranaerophilales bacterium]
MQISSVSSNIFYTHRVVPQTTATSAIKFNGNEKYEISFVTNIPYLIHQTQFFREPDTLETIIDYLENNFKNDKHISIVSGACSSGEEVYSLACILPESIKHKTKITGFDIDTNSVKSAKNGLYTLWDIKTLNSEIKDTKLLNSEGFLIDKDEKATAFQKYCKKRFFNNFVPMNKIQTKTKIISDKQHKLEYLNYRLNFHGAQLLDWLFCTNLAPDKLLNFEEFKSKRPQSRIIKYQKYMLKPNAFSNCSFMQGDITETDKMFEKESVNVFLFRNALYHLICTKTGRRLRSDAKEIVDNIAKQANKILVKDGLFVFGEDEKSQIHGDYSFIKEIMLENGFEPVKRKNMPEDANINIWKKVSDID